jgi:putative DNA methylase
MSPTPPRDPDTVQHLPLGVVIESDEFPFEFLSQLAERESWRKELHRPIYHVHKWWATRLGSIFRGILLGSILPAKTDLAREFYRCHSHSKLSVFDPFMGSGTTIGEAHKLGMTALGRDINPVAVEAVQTALGPLDRRGIVAAFEELSKGVGLKIRSLYRSNDTRGRACDVLYYFWVMEAECPKCDAHVGLFSSHIIARNANPERKPRVQVRCPACGNIFQDMNGNKRTDCPKCHHHFDATCGPARGAKATCPQCITSFTILDAIGKDRPVFRPYGKLILTADGCKEYLPVSEGDLLAYQECSRLLREEIERGRVQLPNLRLARGYNTRQAMRYNFHAWIDFFNDRQLLALGWLHAAINNIRTEPARKALLTLFSGALEFNNLFTSYKGEGTGAVRHMFSHHILKPERTPIEANVWGTPKSSGGFSNLFRNRLLRAIAYRDVPTEVNGRKSPACVCSPPFIGRIEAEWPTNGRFTERSVYLSTGNSARTGLASKSIDLVVTDPPFFDNVHYSELADFFYAWRQINQHPGNAGSTRNSGEVQDTDPHKFALKLRSVFEECHRVLKDDGLLVFTYHHSRNEGWHSLAEAILGAGFTVINSQPVRAELSVATPKAQAKEPIQLDMILVCRKASCPTSDVRVSSETALDIGQSKLRRLGEAGFTLSRNDRRVVLFGQLLTSIAEPSELSRATALVEQNPERDLWVQPARPRGLTQALLFEDA